LADRFLSFGTGASRFLPAPASSAFEKIKCLATVKIHPRRLHGPWDFGYALDKHTLSSVFIGHNEYGHAEFDTTRSDVGELLFQLKYRHDKAAIEPLADIVAKFLADKWEPPIEAIIPVPPSNSRVVQPVMVVAEALAERIGIPLCKSCVKKTKQTPQLKDITDYDKKREALSDAFTVQRQNTAGKNLLLFDDLFDSGATVSSITKALKEQGEAAAVYLLTLTWK
jgi:predicted amidophosphoribosyltransferase